MGFIDRLIETLGGRSALSRTARLLGVEQAPVGHAERLVSMFGGCLAILALVWLERDLLGVTGAAMLAGSMGATAVLLFAVPHGALSQPWAVLVGHGVSAVIGVTAAKLFPESMLGAALAVGGSIGAMHYLRAIHPPGGATSLIAVIGGPQVQALGYGFVLTPVLANAAVMVVVAILINSAFAWRRYPAAWGRKVASAAPPASEEGLSHADFIAALSRIGTFVDISEEEFIALRAMMREEAARRRLAPEEIRLGSYYSNGDKGPGFTVRRVVDVDPTRNDGSIIWRVVAGRDRDQQGLSTRHDFADWACCEVERSECTWMHKGVSQSSAAAAASAAAS